MTEITLKKGSGKPADTALVEAEFALDVATGKIYSKLSDGKVRALNDAEFIGIDANADNYQYWQYKINGFNTTSVMSTSVLDFQSGDGIQIDKEGYGIKISATGGSAGNPDWADIENKPAEFPPSSHTHLVADITDFDPADYQPVGDYISEAPEDGKQYARKDAGWSEVQAAGGSLWEQNGSDIYYNDGNVGIGTESPAAYGRLSLIQTEDSGVGGLAIVDSTYAQSLKLWCEADKAHIFSGNSGQKDLVINSGGGKVGIGGEPGTRAVADYIDQAKAKIKSWTATIKTKLDEEPKANKKAVTLEVTDDAFEVIPTEDLVAEWMSGRAIGGGDAKLQVAGAGYFSTNLHAAGIVQTSKYINVANNGFIRGDYAGELRFQGGAGGFTFYNNQNNSELASLTNVGNLFVSGTIYGTVDDVPSHVKAITPTQIANWDSGTGGGGGGATLDGRISDTDIMNWNHAWDWGNHATAGYQPAGDYALAGASYTKAESDGKYQPAGSYLSSITAGTGIGVSGSQVSMLSQYPGNYGCAGNFTATGNVTAYSDESLKDNIQTAPTGKLDQLRGVEFNWKESGDKDAGVVAQELEKVLPHLVHENEDQKLSVNYNGLVAYLIEEVKSLKAEVEALKS